MLFCKLLWYDMVYYEIRFLRLNLHKDATTKYLDHIQPNLKKIKMLEVNARTVSNLNQKYKGPSSKCLDSIKPNRKKIKMLVVCEQKLS